MIFSTGSHGSGNTARRPQPTALVGARVALFCSGQGRRSVRQPDLRGATGLLFLLVAGLLAGGGAVLSRGASGPAPASAVSSSSATVPEYVEKQVAGWKVFVQRTLLETEPEPTARALELLERQLKEIVRVVPAPAVTSLQSIALYFSPEYPGVRPTAEFHPDAGWLREHGRNPAMAGAVEFTNIRRFEAETQRMPNFTLHELAHAYHHRCLLHGFANPEIKAAYEQAKSSGRYDRVERCNGPGKTNTWERAYAMTNPMEYFAETTEAFFSRNDFFPFTRQELQAHDPGMWALLKKLWQVPETPASRAAPSPGIPANAPAPRRR